MACVTKRALCLLSSCTSLFFGTFCCVASVEFLAGACFEETVKGMLTTWLSLITYNTSAALMDAGSLPPLLPASYTTRSTFKVPQRDCPTVLPCTPLTVELCVQVVH